MKVSIFNLTAQGLVPAQKKPELPLFSRVYTHDRDAYAVISEGENQRIVKMGNHYEDSYFGPFASIDHFARPISKKFGIGFYYDDIEPDFRFYKPAVDEAIARATEFQAAQAAKKRLAQEAYQQAKDGMKDKYPHLLPAENKYAGAQHVAKNARIELKMYFPGVKFSVRSERSTVNVSWQDGPNEGQVKDIIRKYSDHKTDHSGDFRDYDPSAFTEVFGGCNYLFTHRQQSDETHTKLMTWATERYQAGEQYDTHTPDNLAYRLFNQFAIPANGFQIVKKAEDERGNVYRPESFWKIV